MRDIETLDRIFEGIEHGSPVNDHAGIEKSFRYALVIGEPIDVLMKAHTVIDGQLVVGPDVMTEGRLYAEVFDEVYTRKGRFYSREIATYASKHVDGSRENYGYSQCADDGNPYSFTQVAESGELRVPEIHRNFAFNEEGDLSFHIFTTASYKNKVRTRLKDVADAVSALGGTSYLLTSEHEAGGMDGIKGPYHQFTRPGGSHGPRIHNNNGLRF